MYKGAPLGRVAFLLSHLPLLTKATIEWVLKGVLLSRLPPLDIVKTINASQEVEDQPLHHLGESACLKVKLA
jgi:hypothetical protein